MPPTGGAAKANRTGELPDDLAAGEIVILHDPKQKTASAIVFVEAEAEDDYAKGDAALDAMPAAETPGRRVSVSKYEVAVRMTV